MRVLSGRDVSLANGMAEAIVLVREAFVQLARGEGNVPLRTPVSIDGHEGDGLTLFMPAHLPVTGSLGCKIVSVRPGNRERGLPLITALVVLVDEATGAPLAAIEGSYLTALRTGAGSGVATDLLARPDSRVLLCIGAGAQAATQVEAVCAVRPIERVWVRSRSEESARRFAERIAGCRGIPRDVRVSADPAIALAEADIVCTATTSHRPVFDGRLIRPGTHINAVGAHTPEMQEVDAETVRRARIVVDSRSACLAEAGDLIAAVREGKIGGPESWIELGAALDGLAAGRQSDEEITYFKSVGNAAQDMAVGLWVVREAERLGFGTSIDLTPAPSTLEIPDRSFRSQRLSSTPDPVVEDQPGSEEETRGTRSLSRAHWVGIALVLANLTSLAFIPALRNPFVGWDDMVNFLTNRDFRGLGWSNLRWACTTYLMGVYEPLGWIMHEVQYQVWGMDPRWYHLCSVLFHAVNTLSIWALCIALLDRVDRAQGKAPSDRWTRAVSAAFAVALYAVHPLRVEAVAWLSCQTYLPSVALAIMSILAYLRACDEITVSKRIGWLALAWLVFAVALLMKIAVVSLPFVLLILDVYPLRRIGPGRWLRREALWVYLEKLGFLALAVPFMVIAVRARWPLETRPNVGLSDLFPRLAQSFYGLWFYPIKTVAPVGISAYYPLPSRVEDYYRWPFAAALAATVVTVVVAFFLRRRWPGLVAALVCYLVCVGPSLGIIRTTHNIAADRYCYVASISGAVVLAYALDRLARRRALWRSALTLAAVLIVALSALSWRLCLTWRSMDALWTQCGFDIHEHYQNNLALAFQRIKERRVIPEAKFYFLTALTDDPNSLPALLNLGKIFWDEGKTDDAEEMWTRALALKPNSAEAMTGLGLIQDRKGRFNDAERWHRRALKADPNHARAHNNLGVSLYHRGDLESAEAEFTRSILLAPEDPEPHYYLGKIRVDQNNDAQAILEFAEAIRLDPDDADAHSEMGSALLRAGLIDEASDEFTTALRVAPNHRAASREAARLRESQQGP